MALTYLLQFSSIFLKSQNTLVRHVVLLLCGNVVVGLITQLVLLTAASGMKFKSSPLRTVNAFLVVIFDFHGLSMKAFAR